MSSSSNKKIGSQSGLRILWIPGRKKNNRKGQYNPTNKGYSPYSNYAQRPNEAWSLGGAKNHASITKTDFSDMSESVSSTATPLCISGSVALTKECLSAGDVVPVAHDPGNQSSPGEKECNLEVIKEDDNKDVNDGDDDNHCSNYNNAATLALRDRKKTNGKDNLDSIEHLDNDLSDSEYDDTDAIPKKFKKKKKDKEDDSMVTCLYYSLMCCECSIS